MIKLVLKTIINGSPEQCFDASRDIDLHAASMAHTSERAVAGKTSGLIRLGESVTWSAKHFGLTMGMTVVITQMDFPYSFTDEMKKGPFQFLHHIHIFEKHPSGTLMTDIFTFQSPFGLCGRIVDRCFLKFYMGRLLTRRNRDIKKYVETMLTKH